MKCRHATRTRSDTPRTTRGPAPPALPSPSCARVPTRAGPGARIDVMGVAMRVCVYEGVASPRFARLSPPRTSHLCPSCPSSHPRSARLFSHAPTVCLFPHHPALLPSGIFTLCSRSSLRRRTSPRAPCRIPRDPPPEPRILLVLARIRAYIAHPHATRHFGPLTTPPDSAQLLVPPPPHAPRPLTMLRLRHTLPEPRMLPVLSLPPRA